MEKEKKKTAGRENWRLKREQRNGFEDMTEWRPGRRKKMAAPIKGSRQ